MSAITLIEAAKLEEDFVKKNIIEVFPESSPVLMLMPFMTVPGGVFKYNREAKLPQVGFRAINEQYAASSGLLDPAVETTKVFGGVSEVDRALINSRGGDVGDIRAVQDRMFARSMALFFTKMFFDGDTNTDPRQFDGLNKRLEGTDMEIEAGADGANLSLSMLDDLIDAIEGGPDVLFMSKKMRRELTKLMRNSSQITYGEDAFGRQVMKYADIPVAIIETGPDGNLILDFDETQGSNSNTGSIYAVRFGEESGVAGIQNAPMEIIDHGLCDDLKYKTTIEWQASFVIQHPKSAARLKGITATV